MESVADQTDHFADAFIRKMAMKLWRHKALES